MKIIEQGQIPERAIHRVQCGFCNTRFEYDDTEVTYQFVYGFMIECPFCGTVHSLRDNGRENGTH
jgi:redox-regulated HSP33 family molecular chaperone